MNEGRSRRAVDASVAFVRRHPARLVASLAIGGGLAALLAEGGLTIVPSGETLGRVLLAPGRPAWLVVYLALLVSMHTLRASRFRHLLAPLGGIGFAQNLALAFVAFAAILLAPLRTGEVVRPLLVARHTKVGLAEVTGAVFAERFVDGFWLSAALLAALRLAPARNAAPDRVAGFAVPPRATAAIALGAAAFFALAFVGLALAYALRERLAAVVERRLSARFPRLAPRAVTLLMRVTEGFKSFPDLRHLAPFVAETAAYWAANALGLFALAKAVGLDEIGVAEATVVMGCLGLGVLVPAGPGHFGAFRISLLVALALYVGGAGTNESCAVFVFAHFAAQLTVHLAGAALGAAHAARAATPAVDAPRRVP